MAKATIISEYPSSASAAALELTFTGGVQLSGVAFAGCALVATGGTPSYTFSISSGSLPAGITLNSDGTITGTATTTTDTFTGKVVDSLGASATFICVLNVGGGGITGSSAPLTLVLAGGAQIAGQQFSGCVLVAAGGAAPYNYSLYSGSLPSWMNPINASTGALTVTSPSPGVGSSQPVPPPGTFSFVAKVTDAASPPNTATFNVSVLVIALGPVGAQYNIATLTSLALQYETANSVNAVTGGAVTGGPGDEVWQVRANASVTSNPLIAYWQFVLCETAVLVASTPTGVAISTAQGTPGNTFNILATPCRCTSSSTPAGWTQRTCTVGANGAITNISPPVEAGAATLTVNGWVLVGPASASSPGHGTAGGTTYGVTSWLPDGSGCQLQQQVTPCSGGSAAWPATGTGQYFSTMEFRYGNITNGDTLWVTDGTGNYTLRINTISQVLDQCGRSTWNVTWGPVALANPITGWNYSTQPVPAVTNYILDINGAGCDQYAGSMYYFQNYSQSSAYTMGGPSAYTGLMVTVSNQGVWNTWPVVGITPGLANVGAAPGFNPFGVEVQTIGSLSLTRANPTQVGAGTGVVNGQYGLTGETNNLIGDAAFSATIPSGAYLEPYSSNWCAASSNYLSVRSAIAPANAFVDLVTNGSSSNLAYTSGKNALKLLNANAVYSDLIACKPGNQFTATLAATGSAGFDFVVGFFDVSGVTYINSSGNPSIQAFSAGSSWQVCSHLSVQAPANASYVYIGIVITGAGNLWINNVTLTQTSAALGIDAYGNPTIAAQGVVNAMIAGGAVQSAQMAANSITQANAALASLSVLTSNMVQSPQFGSLIYTNIYNVVANSIQADYSVLGNLIAGSITIAMNLTAGGAVRFASPGGIIVAINDPVTGHAFVASNTTPGLGATTVLDGGYIDTFATVTAGYLYPNNFSAVLGEQVVYGGSNSWALTLSDSMSTPYGTIDSSAQFITNAFVTTLLLAYYSPYPGTTANASIILNASGITGTFMQLSPSVNGSSSPLVPNAAPGVMFVGTTNSDTGTHFYICLGSGFTKIV